MVGTLPTLEKIQLDLNPDEVATSLCSDPEHQNIAFLDSAGNFPQKYHHPCSIIASDLSSIIKGPMNDGKDLTEELAKLKKTHPNVLPIGWIDYNNHYTLGLFQQILVFNHTEQQWYTQGSLHHALNESPKSQALISISQFTSNFSQDDYEARVRRIKEYIVAGDIYQANLTQRFEAEVFGENLFSLYQSLRNANPAPMATYLRLDGKEILSSSPETFLHINGKQIESRPIKGTRARFSDRKKDYQSAQELLNSEKENAELTMITDLLRNDIGQVCEFGSVHVPDLNQLETLRHVYHLVSRVTGTLLEDCSHAQAIAACSPGGSITGAPKFRAMQIIDELENVPRGIYTGAIGYFDLGGTSQFSIAIRTIIRNGNKLRYHVGAGIVADSDPTREYEETLQKAKGIREALSTFSS